MAEPRPPVATASTASASAAASAASSAASSTASPTASSAASTAASSAASTAASSAALADQIGNKARRKLRARRRSRSSSVWFGLGMMGLVGWSVVVPTMLGGALGMWIDKQHHFAHGATLPLLMIGLAMGCMNAWHWVSKEDAAMAADNVDSDDDSGSAADHTEKRS